MPKRTVICPTCQGEKWVVEKVDDGRAEVTERCPECKGDGFVYVEDKPAKKTAPLVSVAKDE